MHVCSNTGRDPIVFICHKCYFSRTRVRVVVTKSTIIYNVAMSRVKDRKYKQCNIKADANVDYMAVSSNDFFHIQRSKLYIFTNNSRVCLHTGSV